MARQEQDLVERRILTLPGGSEMLQMRKDKSLGKHALSGSSTVHSQMDEARDKAAAELLHNRQISAPSYINGEFHFTCFSSNAFEGDPYAREYDVRLSAAGKGSCTCLDFSNRGGACKHMRAALLRFEELKSSLPQLQWPDIHLHSDLHQKYGTEETGKGTGLDSALAMAVNVLSISDEVDEDYAEPTPPGFEDRGRTFDAPSEYTQSSRPNSPISSIANFDLTGSRRVSLDRSLTSSSSGFFGPDDGDDEGEEFVGNRAVMGVDDQCVLRVLHELDRVMPQLVDLPSILAIVPRNLFNPSPFATTEVD